MQEKEIDFERSRKSYDQKKGISDGDVKTLEDPLRIFDGQLTAGDVLALLYEKYEKPDNGFFSRDASGFLFCIYEACPRGGKLYRSLTELGFLSAERRRLFSEGPPRHFYRFTPNYVEHCKRSSGTEPINLEVIAEETRKSLIEKSPSDFKKEWEYLKKEFDVK